MWLGDCVYCILSQKPISELNKQKRLGFFIKIKAIKNKVVGNVFDTPELIKKYGEQRKTMRW